MDRVHEVKPRRWHRYQVIALVPLNGAMDCGFTVTRRAAARQCAFMDMICCGFIRHYYRPIVRADGAKTTGG